MTTVLIIGAISIIAVYLFDKRYQNSKDSIWWYLILILCLFSAGLAGYGLGQSYRDPGLTTLLSSRLPGLVLFGLLLAYFLFRWMDYRRKFSQAGMTSEERRVWARMGELSAVMFCASLVVATVILELPALLRVLTLTIGSDGAVSLSLREGDGRSPVLVVQSQPTGGGPAMQGLSHLPTTLGRVKSDLSYICALHGQAGPNCDQARALREHHENMATTLTPLGECFSALAQEARDVALVRWTVGPMMRAYAETRVVLSGGARAQPEKLRYADALLVNALAATPGRLDLFPGATCVTADELIDAARARRAEARSAYPALDDVAALEALDTCDLPQTRQMISTLCQVLHHEWKYPYISLYFAMMADLLGDRESGIFALQTWMDENQPNDNDLAEQWLFYIAKFYQNLLLEAMERLQSDAARRFEATLFRMSPLTMLERIQGGSGQPGYLEALAASNGCSNVDSSSLLALDSLRLIHLQAFNEANSMLERLLESRPAELKAAYDDGRMAALAERLAGFEGITDCYLKLGDGGKLDTWRAFFLQTLGRYQSTLADIVEAHYADLYGREWLRAARQAARDYYLQAIKRYQKAEISQDNTVLQSARESLIALLFENTKRDSIRSLEWRIEQLKDKGL